MKSKNMEKIATTILASLCTMSLIELFAGRIDEKFNLRDDDSFRIMEELECES